MTRLTFGFLLVGLTACAAVLPLEFESNQGQAHPEVRFLARKPSGSILLTGRGMTVQALGGLSISMTLVGGSDAAPAITGEQPLAGVSNYIHGSDRRNWHTGIRHYGRVRYANAYPGIDLVFYGNADSVEYDFVVAPGRDPSAIQLSFDGVTGVRIGQDGSLIVSSPRGDMRQHPPRLYQELDSGGRREILGRYRQISANQVGFEVAGQWDRSRTLVIDPVLVYSAYLGISGSATVSAVGADSAGNSYIAGSITSPDLPVARALQTGNSGVGFYRSSDQAVNLGSANADLGGLRVDALAVDSKNAGVVFAGTSHGVFRSLDSGATWTPVPDLPLNEFPAIAIDPTSSLVIYAAGDGLYKSVDGGASWKKLQDRLGIKSITISPQNPNLLYVGNSVGILRSSDGGVNLDFLILGYICNAVAVAPNNASVMFAGINTRGVFRTLNGGTGLTRLCVTGNCADPVNGNAVAFDPKDVTTIYLGTSSGVYRSPDYGVSWTLIATTTGKRVLSIAFDPNNANLVYLGTGSGLMKSTNGGLAFVPSGPSGVDATAVAVDPKSRYVYTGLSSNPDAFISKLAPDGKSLLYSTYFGGSGADTVTAMAVDSSGSVAFCGTTDSSDLPTRNPIQKTLGGGTDIYLARLSPTGDALVFSTYLGGKGNDGCRNLSQDAKGALYVLGETNLPSGLPGANAYPVVKGAFQATSPGGQDCVVSKLDANATVLTYSTYLGGNDGDLCLGSAVDGDGNLWITGSTFSGDFPNTGANFGTARPSPTYFPQGTGFIAKLDATGSKVAVAGFLGAQEGAVQGQTLALGPSGRIYVGGIVSSGDFPLTGGALSTESGLGAFLIALEPDAVSQLYGATIPGVNRIQGLQVDAQGNAWAATDISASGTFVPSWDAFDNLSRKGLTAAGLIEIDPSGASILYATNLGGLTATSRADATTSLAPDGTLFVAGHGSSTDFQTAAQTFQTTTYPDVALFVEKIDTRSPAPPVVTGVATADGVGTGPFAQGTVILSPRNGCGGRRSFSDNWRCPRSCR